MKNINQVTLLGNITRSPELRYTPGGNAVLGFSIATNRQWTDKASGEKKEAVDFHNIVFWGKAAELINQYTAKGSRILVQGRLQTRTWEKDGAKRYTTEIVGNDFVIFDRKPDGVQSAGEEPAKETKQEMNENLNAEATALGIEKNIKYSEAFKELFGREPTGGKEDMTVEKPAEPGSVSPDDIPF